jgi:hypothetical protein
MRRFTDHILVAIYVALAALPALALAFGIHGRALRGTFKPTPVPSLTLGAVLHERFQAGLVAWFEANLGFKGNSIAFDSALLYRVFRETKPGSPVRIGRDGVLFIDEDINYYNKHGDALPTVAHVDEVVTQIARLQRRFAAEHRALVPVLIPAKTSVWRDAVPDNWTLPLGDPRPSDLAVYRAFQAALVRHGVTFVDARAMFEAAAAPRTQLWGSDARHWSSYGACLAMQEVTRDVAALTGHPMTYECTPTTIRGLPSHADFDLWALLNAWKVHTAVREIPAVTHAAPATTEWLPSALIIGTSFCWGLLRDAEDSKRFGKLDMNYYDQTFVHWPENVQGPIVAGTAEWNATTLGKDVYILDLFEGYLGAPDTYADKFLAELEHALPAR